MQYRKYVVHLYAILMKTKIIFNEVNQTYSEGILQSKQNNITLMILKQMHYINVTGPAKIGLVGF